MGATEDKVLVHRGLTTLDVLVIGLAVQGLVSAMAAFSAPAIGSAALGETIGKPWFTPMLTVDGTS